jgi:hypothetical protein
MTDILKVIQEAWGWCGIEPAEVIAVSPFGNVIVLDTLGGVWRICPEELAATKIAHEMPEFEALRDDTEFVRDWEMEVFRAEAERTLGPADKGRCYCLKIPAILGGQYASANLGTISIAELLGTSGSMAFQIKELPNGARVRLVVQEPN